MDKTALVTGVSKNIGRSICEKFVTAGYHVLGTYRYSLEDAGERSHFVEQFPSVELFKVDLSDQDSVTQFLQQMRTRQLDVVVNNAGMFNMLPDGRVRNEFLDFDLQAFTDLLNCDLVSMARICIELRDCIRENGSIVNIASGAGENGAFASISYNAAKAAVINLTQSLANNYYYYNKVRVNSVSPGWIMGQGGAMNTNAGDPTMRNVARLTPMGRCGYTTEVADVVYYLCSDSASFITGADVAVDGGYSRFDAIYYEEATGESLLKEEPGHNS